MVLGFKQKFPWGEPTYFREKILYGVGKVIWLTPRQIKKYPKIHTIRAGTRWKSGDKIHMAYGVRSKNYEQFNKGIPELEVVKSVQKIEMILEPGCLLVTVSIDGRFLGLGEIEKLAINDGFPDINDFFEWFNKDFTGQIIHWTDLRY
jgi:hypothetical protein